jgi:hypothetical protein
LPQISAGLARAGRGRRYARWSGNGAGSMPAEFVRQVLRLARREASVVEISNRDFSRIPPFPASSTAHQLGILLQQSVTCAHAAGALVCFPIGSPLVRYVGRGAASPSKSDARLFRSVATAQNCGLHGSHSRAMRSHSARFKARPKISSRLLSNSRAHRSTHVFICGPPFLAFRARSRFVRTHVTASVA